MANQRIGSLTRQEICDAMRGLVGARAKSEAERLANFYGISVSRVYDLSKEERPRRKPRADKGKRRADLLQHDGLKLAAEQVVNQKLKPELAIEVANLNGQQVPVCLATFQRYLREHGINRKANAQGKRAHRRWEASAPMELFQFDITGLKVRWLDVNTRKILKIQIDDKNHPNTKRNLVRLWSMVLKDDHSRLTYQRFFAVHKPNSSHVIEFLLEGFRIMGVPLTLYSDNDAVIISQRMRRAEAILNKTFETSGGFRLLQHEPNNAQATGKVERAHQVVEEFDKLIGVKYTSPTLAELNNFSLWLCDRYNRTVNRATGEEPRIRFRAGHNEIRVPPPAILDAAFKADIFEVRINADVTIEVDKVFYQLPRTAQLKGQPNPFLALAGLSKQKISIVWPPDVDFFTAILADGSEYTIDRIVAHTDAAGQFRKLPETKAQTARKSLRASAAERKQTHKAAGTELLVPGFNTQVEADTVSTFPRQRVETDPALLNVLTHGAASQLNQAGRLIDYFTAAELLQEDGTFNKPLLEDEKSWLKDVFAGRSEIEDTELVARLAERPSDSEAAVIPMQIRSA